MLKHFTEGDPHQLLSVGKIKEGEIMSHGFSQLKLGHGCRNKDTLMMCICLNISDGVGKLGIICPDQLITFH